MLLLSRTNGKHGRSTVSESNFKFWIKLCKQSSWTSSAMLQDSGTTVIQMLRFCCAKKNHKFILMYFDRIVVPWELGELLQGSKSWIWFYSRMTSESELFSCHAIVEPNCYLVQHGRSPKSELGLKLCCAKKRRAEES